MRESEHGQSGVLTYEGVREHLAFLNEATARIGDGTDMVAVAGQFAAALVPRLADFAAVHLLDALFVDGAPAPPAPGATASSLVRRVAVAHDEPAERWLALVPEGAVQIMHDTSPCHEAMATGMPVRVDRVTPDRASAMALSHSPGDLYPLVAERAYLAVPLVVRGRVLGCVALTRRPGRAEFDEVDVLSAGQLAAQAALGVDNARLFRGQVATAAEFRRGVLPTAPPTLAGVEVAHRYLPANPAVEVGGDWFDTIALPGSRVAIVIGDVMGHGVRSAAVMGHLRIAVQTLAALDLPPGQLLRQLDSLALQLGDDHLATCLYAVYDPIASCCVIANAGHLAPMLVRADGAVERIEVPSGAPIGVGGVAFDTAEVPIRDGDVLVLYTDGLVEARGDDIDDRISALEECLELAARPASGAAGTGAGAEADATSDSASAPTPADPEALCDRLLTMLDGDRHEDDVALLAARLTGIPAENIANWLLAPLPPTVPRARRLVRQAMADWGLPEGVRDTTELLATELVTNAVRYAHGPIELRLLRTRTLLCEVRDDDHFLPILLEAGELDEGGRGLFLVSQLAARWGVSRTGSGKVVWFEMGVE